MMEAKTEEDSAEKATMDMIKEELNHELENAGGEDD